MFDWVKKKPIPPPIKEKVSEDWNNLIIKLHSNKPGNPFYRLDILGNSMLVYRNGLLLEPFTDYVFLRLNLKFIHTPHTGDFITIVKVSNGDWQIWRVLLDKECYQSLAVRGKTKIIEL